MIAVVLAGGPHDALARTHPGAINKAFVPILGVTLVERTLIALRDAPSVDRIIAVAPHAAHAVAALKLADETRNDGIAIRDSLRNGLAGLAPDEMVLVSASDLPILNPDAIEDFISRARSTDADVGYGCVEQRVHARAFPQVPHTWAHLRDGTYCGGGMIALKPRALPHLEVFIERLGAARKNPLRLAGLFGWDVLLRYALRQLTIADAETRASQLLGAPARAILSPFAQTAVNVDRVRDIALAESILAASANA